MLRDFIKMALLLALALWATPTFADPLARVTLQWQAPAACPDSAALQAELRRDLEGSQAPSVRLDVQASVEPTATSSWRVHILMRGDEVNSDRVLAARLCTVLAQATSLIVAMQIDPETAATHARALDAVNEPAAQPPLVPTAPIVAYPGLVTPPAPTNTQGNAASSETKTINQQNEEKRQAAVGKVESERTTLDAGFREQDQVPTTPTHLRPFVGAWVMGDGGSLPSVSPGFGGSVGLEVGRWLGEAAIGAWLSRDATSDNYPKPEAGIGLGMVSAAARLCYRVWSAAPFSLSPCAGFEGVRWSGKGNGSLTSPQTNGVWGYAPDARLLGALSISETLSLLAHLDVLLPLNRPKFGFNDAAGSDVRVFQPWPVAFRVGAGVQLYFR